MRHFHYRDGVLYAEEVSLLDIAERFGTPSFIYSRTSIEEQWHAYERAFSSRSHLICYAVKANSNIAVLNVLARMGSGFDIVSIGELERVLEAGGDAGKIVFSGIGKRADEIRRALEAGIKCFNVESRPELNRIQSIAAEMGMQAPVSLRVNPDVDPNTHPYIATGLKENKFGIQFNDALEIYRQAAEMTHIDVIGVACHIGSQITSITPYKDAIRRIKALVSELQALGIKLQHIDVGGGMGISYKDEVPPTAEEFTTAICTHVPEEYEVLIEPGRSIIGNAGIMLTRVEYIKENGDRNFAVVDAAMNDLLRPALYQAWQEIIPAVIRTELPAKRFDVVGPVCESADFLGLDRSLAIQEDEYLVVSAAGAYGFCMSSNYNTRPRAVEVMVNGDQVFVIRRRESLGDLFKDESKLPS